MLTERLYYHDSSLLRFTGTVVESGSLDGRAFVVLDRTAFYPTSGGQPFDRGRLGNRDVVEVLERDDDGAVLHFVSEAIPVGAVVDGEIEAGRRLDHMQQHTGQHVLSAAFIHTANVPTVSFHLGADVSTIDLAGDVDVAAVARAEDEANRVVFADRDVLVRFVTPEEARTLPLRKEPSRTGTLRVVEVPEFDLSACGGTHVPRTGVIGSIVVSASERYKGGMRVSFVCGGRTVRTFRQLREASAAAARLLSVQSSELPDAVARLQAEAREQRLQARTLGEELAAFESAALRTSAMDLNGRRLVACVLDKDQAGLKLLAQGVAAGGGPAVLLVSAARPAAVVIARGGDPGIDAGAVLKAIVAQFGGKGGGRPDLAQGGGIDADAEAVRQFGVELISAMRSTA
jgi:alanyl-tRNA synthetase